MFGFDAQASRIASMSRAFVEDRLSTDVPIGSTATARELAARLGPAITATGLDPAEVFARFTDVVVPSTLALASPRFLAFVPAAPTTASVLFDAVVSAASFSGESWLEAAGAVHAENEVLAWLARVAGLPQAAGGCFVSGGSAGNLSALAVARDTTSARRAVVADTAHASVANALRLLCIEPVDVETGDDGRLTAEAVADATTGADGPAVVVASAGSTNAGLVDDLAGLSDLCRARGWWLHVDAAYGGAALLVASERPRFAGIEHADSLIIDPHKWLFGPLDCCALLYRDPARARRVHTQHGPYIEALHVDDAWNPADHAFHLTRRARGLPVWFSLAVHGTDAYAAAVARGVELARYAASRLRSVGPPVELVGEPSLSVVLFRRNGWGAPEWRAWSERLLAADVAFVTPTSWKGEPVGRLVFLHPETTEDLVDEIAASLR